jgi:hypothetical protein
MPMSPEEFGRMLQADYDMLREVVRISGARVE